VEPHVKERIVGAAVLVALGVWLIPLILDGPDEVAVESETVPAFTLPVAEPIAPVRTEPVAESNTSVPTDTASPESTTGSVAEDSSQQAEAGDDAADTSAPLPAVDAPVASVAVAAPADPPADRSGWSVQVGAFSDKANADQLASRVSTYGYSAFVSEFLSGGNPMYRVRVGGFDSENQADAAAGSISAHGIPSRVISPE
jgi:DedD protein